MSEGKSMKRSKKMIDILLLTTSLLCACGNSKNQKIAAEYMEKVNQLDNGQLPSVQEVKDLDAEYYNLTPKQKELVTNYGIVKKYLDLDIELINSLQEKIDSALSKSNVAYKDVKEIEDEYDNMASDEQKYISKIDQLDKFKELNEYDKASIVATRFLKESLKNSDSLQVEEINVKKNGNYYVKVNYSATNSFGGRKDDVACLDVSTTYKIGLIGLSSIVGNFDEGSNTLLGGYLGFKNPEISVDPDKVLDNLDLEFDEQGNY